MEHPAQINFFKSRAEAFATALKKKECCNHHDKSDGCNCRFGEKRKPKNED